MNYNDIGASVNNVKVTSKKNNKSGKQKLVFCRGS